MSVKEAIADTKEAKEQAERPHGDSNSSENIDDL